MAEKGSRCARLTNPSESRTARKNGEHPRDAQQDRKRWRVSRRFWGTLDLECLHKWVILRITPTALLSYRSCKKHEGARASSTLLEGFDPLGQ